MRQGTTLTFSRYLTSRSLTRSLLYALTLTLFGLSGLVGCDDESSPTSEGGSRIAGEEPVAGEEPIAGEEPVAGEEPIAGEEPVAGEEPIAGEEPAGGAWPTTEGPRGVQIPDGVELTELTAVQLNNGLSEELTLELPDDVVSVTMIALSDEQHMVTVQEFIGPDGEALVSANPPGVMITQFDSFVSPFPGPFKSPNRVAVASTAIGTLLAPNNPNVSLTPGVWTYQLAARNASTGMPADVAVDLLIMVRRGEEPTNGVLDVHLHFTGSHGWTAESAPTDPEFQIALERLREFYRAVNVRIGEVTYDDISEEFRTTDAGSMPNSVLHQIYAQNQYSTGVALFFVERITSPFGGGAIGGIAGGTPGPSLVPSTPRSGVVVATEVEPDARAIGHIMGHETGHFLGLYHTSEMLVQNTHDQLDDTPQGQEGNTNLMFPTVTAGDASLSQDQGWVMRRNMNVFPDHLTSESAE